MKVMKNISSWGIIALMAIVVSGGLSGCKKDRDTPTPTPEPNPILTPTPKEVSLAISLTNGGIIKEGKLVNDWVANDEVTIWGFRKDNKPIEVKAKLDESLKWHLTSKLTQEWNKVERATIMFLPFAKSNSSKQEIKVSSIANKKIGNFVVSQYYEDVLISNVDKVSDNISTTLNSPFRQVQLVLENSKYSQSINNIELTIEDVMVGASYSNGVWSGTPATIKVNYKDIEWAGGQSDELYIALPINAERAKAILKYNSGQGEQVIERDLLLESNRPTKLQFIFAEEFIKNPTLEFTIPIDASYWEKANRDAFNLVTSNLGTKFDMTEDFLRLMDFVVIRPLVDEAMHSHIFYKDDMNLIRWTTEAKDSFKRSKLEWGFAYGLETLDGRLVEVYPPTWQKNISFIDGMFGVYAYNYSTYHYITIPEGKYRLVQFICFPEIFGGEINKWYKVPLMDSLGGGETLNGISPYDKRLHERVPMEKSPYKDIDIVEVIDRKASKNIAPRWYLGYRYNNREDFNKGNYDFETIGWSIGNIIEITNVNTTNQKLRGTIVAKAEYLPMYNPIGYWRLEETAKYHDTWGKGGSYYYKPWSFEVGRTDVLLDPNSEQKTSIEIINWNFEDWRKIGGRGYTNIGPEYFIHLYWTDESGKETMMMRVDYPMMNKMQKNNWVYEKDKLILSEIASQFYPDVPERNGKDFANGFQI